MAQTQVLVSESLACDNVEIQGWVLGRGRDHRVPTGRRGGEGRRECEYEEKYIPGRKKLRRSVMGQKHTQEGGLDLLAGNQRCDKLRGQHLWILL